MNAGLLRTLVCSALVLGAVAARGQSYDQAAVRMFQALSERPDPLARYLYLEKLTPQLSLANRSLAAQMSAFALAELGQYDNAVRVFPLKLSAVTGLVLPDVRDWRAESALDVISREAADRRIVMVNEVHHNAQTRALTLQLLPRLRALGFTHLAIEALGDDPDLAKRGYPVRSSGTEYLQEPLYGEIVREGIRLGFVLVAYDAEAAIGNPQSREVGQARHLYDRVFAKDPEARLVLAAGYAHVDKAAGRLGQVRPMAMILAQLSGFDPLSVDQAQFLEVEADENDDYHQLIARFPSDVPAALVNAATGRAWSAAPKLYDISVISPRSLTSNTLGEQESNDSAHGRVRILSNGVQMATQPFVAFNDMQRPAWLRLGGQRRAYPIDTRLCREQIPCVVDAHYIDEPDLATPADIYAFLTPTTSTSLYLRPGRYRLRAVNNNGHLLSRAVIRVSSP